MAEHSHYEILQTPIGELSPLEKAAANYIQLLENPKSAPTALAIARDTYKREKARSSKAGI